MCVNRPTEMQNLREEADVLMQVIAAHDVSMLYLKVFLGSRSSH